MSAPVSQGFKGLAIEYEDRIGVYTGVGFMGVSIQVGAEGVPVNWGQGFQGISIEVAPFYIYRVRIVNVGGLGVNNPVISDLSLHHPSETVPLTLMYDNTQNEAIVNQAFGFGAGEFTVSYTVTFGPPESPVIQYYQNQSPEIAFGS